MNFPIKNKKIMTVAQAIFFVSLFFFPTASYSHEGRHEDYHKGREYNVSQAASRSDNGHDTQETFGYYNPHAGQWVEVPSEKKSKVNPADRISNNKNRKTVFRYNPYSNEWQETTLDAVLTYNQYAGVWSYREQGVIVRYNPYSNTWEEAMPEQKSKYNAEKDAWVYQK